MKNLCLVSVLLSAFAACSSDETVSTKPNGDDRERNSDQQGPTIEPQAPGQQSPQSREDKCGTPEVYADLGNRSLFPARVAAARHPETGDLWSAVIFALPVSEPKQAPDLLTVNVKGGHADVPFIPKAGTYEFATEPLKENADLGLTAVLFANFDEEKGPKAIYIPVGGKLVLEEVSLFPDGETEPKFKGSLQNVKFAEYGENGLVPNGCATTLTRVAFDLPVLPVPGQYEAPEEEPTEEPGPTIEGEPFVPPPPAEPEPDEEPDQEDPS